LVEFVNICRYFASERAINDMTQRVSTELQYLDNGTRTLLESLRQSGEADCSFRQSQVDAAVRFCVKVFGQEHGSAGQGRGSRRRCGEQGGHARERPDFDAFAAHLILLIAATTGRDVCRRRIK
jgi:hypothetical protein